MQVSNIHIAGLMNRIVLFRHELDQSVSQKVHSFRAPDITRFKSYLEALKTYHDHVMDQDPLDLPHWHDRLMEAKDLPTPIETENPSLIDIIFLLEAMYIELAKSQSNDLATGLVIYDSERFVKQYTNLVAFVDDFVLVSTPLDMPENAASEKNN